MIASREDIIQAYRVILKREPESEYAIELHLRGDPTVWDIVQRLLGSDEFTYISSSRSHISLNKCFDGQYISRSLPMNQRIECFLKTHQTLQKKLSFDRIQSIYFKECEIWSSTKNAMQLTAALSAPQYHRAEGELCLTFKANGVPLYAISFSFVPGHVVDRPCDCAILISKMQGKPGEHARLREAAKAFREINAQSVLFAVLCGIGTAVDARCLAGVEARNQVSFQQDLIEVFERNYDDFLVSQGAERTQSGYYVAELPITPKPLSAVSPLHRLRAKKKRILKEEISKQAAETFSSWRDAEAH
jgi:uncharacterized protein VirK/YbjX